MKQETTLEHEQRDDVTALLTEEFPKMAWTFPEPGWKGWAVGVGRDREQAVNVEVLKGAKGEAKYVAHAQGADALSGTAKDDCPVKAVLGAMIDLKRRINGRIQVLMCRRSLLKDVLRAHQKLTSNEKRLAAYLDRSPGWKPTSTKLVYRHDSTGNLVGCLGDFEIAVEAVASTEGRQTLDVRSDIRRIDLGR